MAPLPQDVLPKEKKKRLRNKSKRRRSLAKNPTENPEDAKRPKLDKQDEPLDMGSVLSVIANETNELDTRTAPTPKVFDYNAAAQSRVFNDRSNEQPTPSPKRKPLQSPQGITSSVSQLPPSPFAQTKSFVETTGEELEARLIHDLNSYIGQKYYMYKQAFGTPKMGNWFKKIQRLSKTSHLRCAPA